MSLRMTTSFLLKVITSAIMVALIAEVGRRSTLFAALLASLHVTTVLALVWLYIDTKDTLRVADVASNTFWLIIPSLIFFIVLPLLLRQGWDMVGAMVAAIGVTGIGFFAYIYLLRYFGIKLL
jgi:hypothetical protein